MNFVSPGIENRMPKATVLHKQFQEAEAVLSCGFAGFDPHSSKPSCAPALPAVWHSLLKCRSSRCKYLTCRLHAHRLLYALMEHDKLEGEGK